MYRTALKENFIVARRNSEHSVNGLLLVGKALCSAVFNSHERLRVVKLDVQVRALWTIGYFNKDDKTQIIAVGKVFFYVAPGGLIRKCMRLLNW